MKTLIRKLLFKIFAKEILSMLNTPKTQVERCIGFSYNYIKDDDCSKEQRLHYQQKLLNSLLPHIEEKIYGDEVELSILVFKRQES